VEGEPPGEGHPADDEFLILVMLAAMWNALAGFGGLVSVGQQAYVGFGAYAVIFLTQRGLDPYLAIVVAAGASGVLALLVPPSC
jgi:branched-chain amino acid transport system permease protein